MSTEYKYIKQYSQNNIVKLRSLLKCEVCQQIYQPLFVRSHLRTKKHHKNAIEFAKQLKSVYQSNFKVDSS